MPSDGSGVYSLPAGYLATTGDTIVISQHNPIFEDVRDALTARLMRSGVAPMTGVLKIVDGSVGAPGLALNTNPTWGFYKTATGIGISVSGTQVADFIPGGLTLPAAGLALTAVNLIGATQLTAPATGDTLAIYDLSATANKRISIADFFTVINDFSADASPSRANDYVITYDASAAAPKKVLLQNLPATMPRGYIDGCVLTNGTDATNDIDVAAGAVRDSTNAVDITVAAMAGKQLDANWAPGAAAGMRNSAAGITDTTYHIYAVAKADGTQDIYAHTSTTVATVIAALQAETGGSAYLYARLIGSIIRSGGSILGFVQDGDYFNLKTPVLDINRATPGTSANTETLTVPAGIRVLAFMNIISSALTTYISALDQTDLAPSATISPLGSVHDGGNANGGQVQVRTDTSKQIRSRCISNSALLGVTTGWVHPRGKNT